MKLKKLFILFSMVLALVIILVSCTAHKGQSPNLPTTRPQAIETTMIEVTGEDHKPPHNPETLRIEFDRATGRCKQSFVDGEPTNCKGVPLSATFFCISPDEEHRPNTDINNDGKMDTYCGRVEYLSDGADIHFESNPAAANKKCKKVGGHVYCF